MGYSVDDMVSALPATLSLAIAGNTSLAETCDIVSDAMTGMQMSSKRTGEFADIMASTTSSANTNISLMGETLKYVSPVAGAMGIDMKDLSVAIGLVGNAGVKGSQAGTALRAGLTNLVKPTKEMQKAMDKYGIELKKNEDGSINYEGLEYHRILASEFNDKYDEEEKTIDGVKVFEAEGAQFACYNKRDVILPVALTDGKVTSVYAKIVTITVK